MKVSKTGIKMYERDDDIEGDSIEQALGIAVNLLRKEVNAIALVLDIFQDEIDKLKGKEDG